MSKIKLALVDDHQLFRTALQQTLEQTGKFEILLSAENGLDAEERLKSAVNLPDIVLLDVFMPIKNGYETIKHLTANYPDIKVLALTMEDDIDEVVKMIKGGAVGYMLKDCTIEALTEALEQIYENGFYYNSLTNKAIRLQLEDNNTSPTVNLTDRELEFLKLACSEMTYKEIADKMNVGVRTVDSYRDNLFEKLSARSRVGLVLYAIKNKMFEV